MATSGVLAGTPAALYAPGGVNVAKVVASEVDTAKVANPVALGTLKLEAGLVPARVTVEHDGVTTALNVGPILEGTVKCAKVELDQVTASKVEFGSGELKLESATAPVRVRALNAGDAASIEAGGGVSVIGAAGASIQCGTGPVQFLVNGTDSAFVVGSAITASDFRPLASIRAVAFYSRYGTIAAGPSTVINLGAGDEGVWVLRAQDDVTAVNVFSSMYVADNNGDLTQYTAGVTPVEVNVGGWVTSVVGGNIDIQTPGGGANPGKYWLTRLC